MQTIYFAQTGHHLSNRSGFLDFWRTNGQVQIFGYPLTEEIIEDGRIVQYFERARFELHAAQIGTPQQVQLGRLGHEVLAWQGLPPRIDDPQTGGRYFPETGHTLWGKFRSFWERRDGMQLYGLPLSEVVEEDGRSIQYFERAKFVYFPEELPGVFRSLQNAYGYSLNGLYEVQLGDLGRLVAEQRGLRLDAVSQLEGTLAWHPAIWARRVEVSLSAQWLSAYEGDLLVFRAPVATGRDGFNTPVGDFAIYYRTPMQTMSGCMGGECWDVPHVPWAQYIVGGVALHGTYWHNSHGTGVRPSHGCINLRIEDAQWLYEWADVGTPVTVRY
ncbi:MAG: murein L,D-transpeptidase [Candidatus Viridilinea halotolerans]|uniref:Murein L,D-transpeptidase n=1 Tax=Candidatus Viridilinea halotolerans TaxID=2491704 RepID=A0A426TRZ3_9CHLR|nr:MAG: murein L,D-transpeptidase [Candidatus Viridilinea halotolerans]